MNLNYLINSEESQSVIDDLYQEALKVINISNEDEIVEDEDKEYPISDDGLAEILKENGYPVARRTVAKYRGQMKIPIARLRRAL